MGDELVEERRNLFRRDVASGSDGVNRVTRKTSSEDGQLPPEDLL